jgi:hypothetical protein
MDRQLAAGLVLTYGFFVAVLSLTLEFQRERKIINGSVAGKSIWFCNANPYRDSRSNHGLHRDLFLVTSSPSWSANFPGRYLRVVNAKSLPAFPLLKLSFSRAPPYSVPLSLSFIRTEL